MSYIFNKNHNRTHLPGCKAIDMMNRDKHEVEVDEPRGHLCKWCKPWEEGFAGPRGVLGSGQGDLDHLIGMEACNDPRAHKIFEETGCLNCKSQDGDILMYPHPGGEDVADREGTWWIFFECSRCGYQSSLQKAAQQLHRLKLWKAEKGEI